MRRIAEYPSTMPLALMLLAIHVTAASAGAPTAPVHQDPYGTDLAVIHALLPAGREIAGAYGSTYDPATQGPAVTLRTGSDYSNAVSDNYVYADLDGNGTADLAVVTELAPSAVPGGAPGSGNREFGPRRLLIFLADSEGMLRLVTEAPKAVLSGADGGVFGDPLAGLHIVGARTLVVEHYGGSNERWSISQKFQYRSGEFYLVGQTTGDMDLRDGSSSAVDTNLLTGDQIQTQTFSQEGAKPDEVTKMRLGKKPLVKLADASPVSR